MNRTAIVLVVDYLNPGQLGLYGAAEPRTPVLDRLASQSFVAENAFSDTLDLRRTYRAFLRGLHATIPVRDEADSCSRSLPESCARAGLKTLFMEEGGNDELTSVRSRFGEHAIWEADFPTQLAATMETTRLAQFMDHVIGVLETQPREPALIWVHAASLGSIWDAPRELREALVDESDPPPSDSPFPPVAADGLLLDDPDAMFAIRVAYSAQVAVLDACVEMLAEWVAAHQAVHPTMCLMTAPRGMPLGLHGQFGPSAGSLHEESMHVPLMIATPETAAHPTRLSKFFQPSSIYHTLLDWFELELDRDRGGIAFGVPPSLLSLAPMDPVRDQQIAVSSIGKAHAIRTPRWYLVRGSTDSHSEVRDAYPSIQPESQIELYAKPDDRWERNEIGHHCPEVVECMELALDDFLTCGESSRLDQLTPLPDLLTRDER